jgi:hypothetical protein
LLRGAIEIHSPNFWRSVRDNELGLSLLTVLCSIGERRAPSCYFHFDGYSAALKADSLDRFPSAKTGYSFSCWLRLEHFLSEESGLLTFLDQADRPL